MATRKEHYPDPLGNVWALEGCDRCWCGCKYWEYDRCVDCKTTIRTLLSDPEWLASPDHNGAHDAHGF